MSTEAVTLRREPPGPLPLLAVEHARAAAPVDAPPDLDRAQQVACDLGPRVPLPMQGDTLSLWETLASLGAVDLTVARVAEPHLDALATLREARREGQVRDDDWKARSPEWSAARLWQVHDVDDTTRVGVAHTDGSWRLTGVTAGWMLADRASHAMVRAWINDEPGLFAVDLAQARVAPTAGSDPAAPSTAHGLEGLSSTSVTFDRTAAVVICQPSWYAVRPGRAWSGIGVAAIWYGASVALARTFRAAAEDGDPDQVALLHLGGVDTALARARGVLLEAASVADDPATQPAESALVAQRVRQVVADAAEEVLQRVGHALGPAPLTRDAEHARRVSDLGVYLGQHHAERALAHQGTQVLGASDGWHWWAH